MRRELLKPERAIEKIAGSLLAGSYLIDELGELKVERTKLLKSACLLCVFKAIGHRLRDYPHASNIPETIQHLLNPNENPIHQVRGHPGLGQAAQKALVEGLVLWANRQGSPKIEQTLELLHSLIGDPRLNPVFWKDIDSDVRQTVEWWLTERTLETFFEVFRLQNAVNPAMVAERETFWRGYMENKKISRAWLITSANGYDIARRLLDKSFGRFADGAGPDHLGLMLQISNYVILEMNQNGRTLFWRAGDNEMPSFFGAEYHRARLIKYCNASYKDVADRFHMKHHQGWQNRYETVISRRILR